MSKIALLGAAPSSRKLAPFGDPHWEIWACSPPNYDCPRVDAWFELHSLDRKMGMQGNAPYIEVLKGHPRVYVAAPHPAFPNATVLNPHPLIEKYGTSNPYTGQKHCDFFSSSLAWMMACAIEQKPDKIGLWGIDMAAHEEYAFQRPGMKFFIREAHKLGIDVYCPPQSDLLMPMPLYGFKEQSPVWWKMRTRKEELNERLNNTVNHMDRLKNEELVFRGALDDLSYHEQTYDPLAYGVMGIARKPHEPEPLGSTANDGAASPTDG